MANCKTKDSAMNDGQCFLISICS